MSRIVLIGSLAESLVNFRGDLICHLLATGHEVVAMSPPGPAWVDTQLASWGARRVTIGLDRTGASILSDLRLMRELIRLFKSLQPDVTLAYTIKPVVYSAFAAKIAGVPRITAMITGLGFAFAPPTNFRQGLVRSFARVLYRAAMRCIDTVFFQNPDDEADFRRGGLIRCAQRVVRIRGSGVNLLRFAAQPLPPGPFRFLMIARLLVDKGVREYIAASARLRQSHPTARCHLVGPFDSNPSAVSRAEIDAAVVRGDLVFHGSTDDVRPYLADCHVYVLPSYREGMPRSVLEAMAVGRAVITTDAPGCRETVTEGDNGLLVPVRDIEALSDAMAKLVAAGPEEIQRMGESSRRRVAAEYDVAVVNDQISNALAAHV